MHFHASCADSVILSQSSKHTGKLNYIRITLVTNVDCLDAAPHAFINETIVSITGLIGSATPSSSQLAVGGPGAAIFGGTGAWYQNSGTLMLKIAAGHKISAGISAIDLTLPLVNPARGCQSPRLFTYVAAVCARVGSDTNGSLVIPARYIDVDLATALDEPGSVAGESAPLFVRSPSFVVRKISQSNPVAGAVNIITLTLIANVDLSSTTVLTLRGLAPTSTPSSPRTLLAGGYSVSPELGSGTGTYDFYGDTWTSNDRGSTWLQVSNGTGASWSAREGFALALVNSSIFLAGGWGGGGAGYLQDVWVTIDVGHSWQLVTSAAPWPPRGYFEMVRHHLDYIYDMLIVMKLEQSSSSKDSQGLTLSDPAFLSVLLSFAFPSYSLLLLRLVLMGLFF